MTAEKLLGYDPSWEAKYGDQSQQGAALWRRAVAEMQEFGAMRTETREAWINTLRQRKTIRKRAFATTADVARKMFNVLACRAFLAHYKIETPPDANDFNSLREIREYFTEQMKYIKAARARKPKRPMLLALPILPREEAPFLSEALEAKKAAARADQERFLTGFFGAGVLSRGIVLKPEDPVRVQRQAELDEAFDATEKTPADKFKGLQPPDANDESRLVTQAFYLPDIDKGFPVIVMTQKLGDERFICLSGKSLPSRFRRFMPDLAAALAERLFPDEDRRQMRFFVHHPLEYGEKGHEQYWKYDMHPDARGAFHVAARHSLPAVPHAIANQAFVDGLPQHQTSIVDLTKHWRIEAFVAGEITKQERFSARRAAILQRRNLRKSGRAAGHEKAAKGALALN